MAKGLLHGLGALGPGLLGPRDRLPIRLERGREACKAKAISFRTEVSRYESAGWRARKIPVGRGTSALPTMLAGCFDSGALGSGKKKGRGERAAAIACATRGAWRTATLPWTFRSIVDDVTVSTESYRRIAYRVEHRVVRLRFGHATLHFKPPGIQTLRT